MLKPVLFTASALALSSFTQIALAADMIVDESSYGTQTSYGRYEVCEDLLLVYRAPHEPRREVVRVCHPPIAGQ